MHRTRSGTDKRTDGHCDHYKNQVIGQGQGHSDPKLVRDTWPSQDASTHQIWNSYLKEYRRYAPDKAGRTDGQCDYLMPPKVPLGHKKKSSLNFHMHIFNVSERYM